MHRDGQLIQKHSSSSGPQDGRRRHNIFSQHTMQEDFEFVDSHVECDSFNGIGVRVPDAQS